MEVKVTHWSSNLGIQVDLIEFSAEFQMININPSYNLLLERPWIHKAEGVPFILQ